MSVGEFNSDSLRYMRFLAPNFEVPRDPFRNNFSPPYSPVKSSFRPQVMVFPKIHRLAILIEQRSHTFCLAKTNQVQWVLKPAYLVFPYLEYYLQVAECRQHHRQAIYAGRKPGWTDGSKAWLTRNWLKWPHHNSMSSLDCVSHSKQC